jgi:hypothetical protein
MKLEKILTMLKEYCNCKNITDFYFDYDNYVLVCTLDYIDELKVIDKTKKGMGYICYAGNFKDRWIFIKNLEVINIEYNPLKIFLDNFII